MIWIGQARGYRRAPIRGAEVRGEHFHGYAVPVTQPAGQPFEYLLPPRDQHQPDAVAGERLGERLPDTGGGG